MSESQSESQRLKRPRSLPPRDPQEWVHRSMAKYRMARHQIPYRPDAEFFELADSVVIPEATLLGYDRLYVFWQAIRNVVDVPGDAAEVGSFRGGSAYFIAAACLAIIGQPVPLHAFDTFEGHPESAISEHDPFHKPGRFHRTSYERVCQLLAPFPHVHVHKGDVVSLLPSMPEAAYRLVHIDTDLYRPTVACLAYFSSRLSRGGVIVLDDYASPKCPGVLKAAGEFLDGTPGFQVWDVRTEQLVLVKR